MKKDKRIRTTTCHEPCPSHGTLSGDGETHVYRVLRWQHVLWTPQIITHTIIGKESERRTTIRKNEVRVSEAVDRRCQWRSAVTQTYHISSGNALKSHHQVESLSKFLFPPFFLGGGGRARPGVLTLGEKELLFTNPIDPVLAHSDFFFKSRFEKMSDCPILHVSTLLIFSI